MKVVLDTNVVISAAFFGGLPLKVLDAALDNRFTVCANSSIVDEYIETALEMVTKRKGHINRELFDEFMDGLEISPPVSSIKICRDPDDDKFINCALDAKAIYIVSGDNDLLSIKEYDDVEIVTVREFWERFEGGGANETEI